MAVFSLDVAVNTVVNQSPNPPVSLAYRFTTSFVQIYMYICAKRTCQAHFLCGQKNLPVMFKNVQTKIHLGEVIQLGCVEIALCMVFLFIKERDVMEDT